MDFIKLKKTPSQNKIILTSAAIPLLYIVQHFQLFMHLNMYDCSKFLSKSRILNVESKVS